jgi:alpha-beta hydrolase superfamily lysophospholipase
VEERTLVDTYGVEVSTRWWTTEAPRGVVLVSHGASEHSGRYDRFARALNDAGFDAAALDHRGHGGTGPAGTRALMGPGGGRAVVDDLHLLRAEARSTVGDVPVFLFGHSLGSLIVLAYLTHHAEGLAGAVLCAVPMDVDAAGALAVVLESAIEAGMRDEPVDVLGEHNAPFEPARTPFDWLSRDPAEVDRYLADPLCGDDHPLTYGYLIDLFGVVAPARDALGSISCPVLVVAGDQDPAAGMGAHATRLAEALRAAEVDADLTIYEGARHELLNETNRDEVTADVVGWLRSRS